MTHGMRQHRRHRRPYIHPSGSFGDAAEHIMATAAMQRKMLIELFVFYFSLPLLLPRSAPVVRCSRRSRWSFRFRSGNRRRHCCWLPFVFASSILLNFAASVHRFSAFTFFPCQTLAIVLFGFYCCSFSAVVCALRACCAYFSPLPFCSPLFCWGARTATFSCHGTCLTPC